jgi:cytochrome c
LGLSAAIFFFAPGGADANEGEALFKKNCQACHTLNLDEPRRQGPPLVGIVGKIAGKVDGFPYSKGLKTAEWAWSEEKLDAWLTRPKGVVSDTYMNYKQDDPQVRQKIISFLNTIGG